MPDLVGVIFSFVIVSGGYLYYAHWNRRSGERERAALRGMPARDSERRPGASATALVLGLGGVGVVLGLLFLGSRRYERSSQARHPAVKEHLAELTELAEGRMGCPRTELVVSAQEPTLARVKGCARELTFRWGRRVKGGEARWNQIDPSCTVGYLGCALPCE